MSTDIERSALTQLVLTTLRASGQTIGDGELPDESWIGEPNMPSSTFKPFAVLAPLRADHSDGPIGASQGDWRFPYLVEYFGVRRDQCEWIGDKLRGTLSSLRGHKMTLGSSSYKVQYVRADSVGQPQKVKSVEPPFWYAQDGSSLWLGKEPS